MQGLVWWNSLQDQWKTAYREVFLKHDLEPDAEELDGLKNTEVLRLAGPSAPYPNMTFSLTNLSGLEELTNLKVLVVTHHEIEELEVLGKLRQLKRLFLFNNKIADINGLESLSLLEQLYMQFNNIRDFSPLKSLISLRELYIHNNATDNLDWLTDAHSEKLETFFCLPNDRLKRKEIMRVERELGIECRRL